MRVILARHGDAVGTAGKFHGMMDTPLTSKGAKDVASLADELKQYKPVTIYASPLSRTKQSAQILAEKLRIPVVLTKALYPLDLGDYVGKPTDKYREQVRYYLAHPDSKIPNGEKVNWWASRFISFFNKLAFKQSDETVIIMTHGRNIILAKADLKMGNNLKYDVNELTNADKSTEHAGYAIASGGASGKPGDSKFQIVTPRAVPAGQS